VALFETHNKATKAKTKEMFDMAKRNSTNKAKAAVERPSDILGDSIMARAKHIKNVLQTSGKKLNEIAQGLKGKAVNNFDDVMLNVQDDIAGLGARIDDTGNINFAGSSLEDLGSNEKVISNVYRRLNNAQDAADLHNLKRYIDNNVNYGKASEGLVGESEHLLKGWRKAINDALGNTFDDYKTVNGVLSKNIDALDGMHELLGNKVNINDPLAGLRAGTVAETVLSNNRSRGNVLTSLKKVQDVSREFGMKADDDIIQQILFADMLEDVFDASTLGTQRSFKGQITRGVTDAAGDVATGRGMLQTGLDLGKKGVDAIRGITPQSRQDALEALINSTDDITKVHQVANSFKTNATAQLREKGATALAAKLDDIQMGGVANIDDLTKLVKDKIGADDMNNPAVKNWLKTVAQEFDFVEDSSKSFIQKQLATFKDIPKNKGAVKNPLYAMEVNMAIKRMETQVKKLVRDKGSQVAIKRLQKEIGRLRLLIR
jgi:uncharacterized protein YukE